MTRHTARLGLVALCAVLFLTAGTCDGSLLPGDNGGGVNRENGELQGDCLQWDGWDCGFDMLDLPLAVGSRVTLTHVPASDMPIAMTFLSTQERVLKVSGETAEVLAAGHAAILAMSDRYEALNFKNLTTVAAARADIVRTDLDQAGLDLPGPDTLSVEPPNPAVELQVILRSKDGHPLGGWLDWTWSVTGPFRVAWISMNGRSIRVEATGDGAGTVSVTDPGSGRSDEVTIQATGIAAQDAGSDASDSGSDASDSGSDASDASDGGSDV